MIGSLGNLMFKLHNFYKPSNVIFVANIKFPWATYHTIVPLTEELYCLNKIVREKYQIPLESLDCTNSYSEH